jgi:hypothetical protein
MQDSIPFFAVGHSNPLDPHSFLRCIRLSHPGWPRGAPAAVHASGPEARASLTMRVGTVPAHEMRAPLAR